jgi:murein L,D-transpeptidase YcbB/YkuD
LKDDGLVGKNTYAALFREKQEPIDTSKLQTKQLKSVATQQKSPTSRQTTPAAQTNTTVADTGLDFS